MANVPLAFKIIIKHFSGDTLCGGKEEIYRTCVLTVLDQCGLLEDETELNDDSFKRALRYLNYFRLAENPEHKCWRIKSVDEMCERLPCVHNSNIRNDGQPLTAPIAFEIIIQEISGDNVWRSTTEIKTLVLELHTNQGGHPKDSFKAGSVLSTLRFLTHFGLADKRGQSDWRIKSVEEMCKRLRALRRTFHLL